MSIMPTGPGGISSGLVYPINIDLGMGPDGRIKPSTLMRWSATPALRYEMVRQSFTDPLLLVTVQRLEPVKLQGMDKVDMVWRDWRHFTEGLDVGWMFLKLPTAGQLRVMVSVVNANSGELRDRIDKWILFPFEGSHGNLYHESGAYSGAFYGMRAINTGFRFLVFIAKEDLARPLPAFADRLFDEYFSKPPKDTCRVWHRVPALLLMILGNLLFYWPFRLAVTALMLLGAVKIINWRYASPLRVRERPLQKHAKFTSFWTHTRIGKRRYWGFTFINPFTLLVVPTIYWLGSHLASIWGAAEQQPKHIVPWTWTQSLEHVGIMIVFLVLYVSFIVVAGRFCYKFAVRRGWMDPPDAPKPVVNKVSVMDASLAGVTQYPGMEVRRRRPVRRLLAWFKSETCRIYEAD